MAMKRKAGALAPEDDEPVDPSDELQFHCLGGGNEVGRSCHIVQYKGKTVMLDAGMHPAHEGISALPFYDDFDLSTVDVLLISHFHLDHAASLPYVLSKTNFRGRVFMTHPTKAIYKWLMQDMVRVQNTHSSSELHTQLFTESDHLATFPMIEAIDYHTTHTISSIRITPYPAGHVLGGAMYLLNISDLNILFTGDYSRELDRHLIPAEVPRGVKVDVLITESTYGIASHVPRQEREAALMKSVTSVLSRGGRALMPVFALGRAQELLLILDEYWQKHPEYQKMPIYYASNLARKCMVVYQTYIHSMNDNINRLFQERMKEAKDQGDISGAAGPWDFRYIRSLRSLDRFEDIGPCVMLASPGMLQSGVSRELLERWAPDQRNGVIITGYSVEGTMGKLIVQEPDEIQAIMTAPRNQTRGLQRGPGRKEGEQVMVPRRCTVQEFQFAAHVDGVENKQFIDEVAAPVVILVHGEKSNMMRLKSRLLADNAKKTTPTKVFSPANTEVLKIPFRKEKTAKVVGKLANDISPLAIKNETTNGDEDGLGLDARQHAQLMSGVLVQNDFKLSLMAPEDLREYAGLTTTTLTCRQRLTLSAAGIDLIKWALEGTFGAVREIITDPKKEDGVNGDAGMNGNGHGKEEDADEEIDRTITSFEIMGCVTVHVLPGGKIEVEWEGNMMNDGIADAVLAVLFTVETSPAAVKQSSQHCNHNHNSHNPKSNNHNPHAHLSARDRFTRLCMFLEAQFGSSITPLEHPRLLSPDTKAKINSEMEEEHDEVAEAKELARLHALGIPVPGLEVRVDGNVARVWLEGLEVECESKVFRERVRSVVDRAVETVAPLWVA
ncbi:endoribonuclease YSH1 [Viridothelium virens]|uniref:Endoribonuclease YSH1 n=1 Tax=Viridothelium virens TaxID=1048519 RepID=A0A6A6H032_VIRVR|nr:endoribonuclease YSH1 [Viridothelium virens]